MVGFFLEIGIRSSQLPLGSEMVTCILAEVVPICSEMTIYSSSNSLVKTCSFAFSALLFIAS